MTSPEDEPGGWSVGAMLAMGQFSARHGVDKEQLEPAMPDKEVIHAHDVHTLLGALDLRGAYRLSPRVGLEVLMPLRLAVIRPKFEDQAGRPVTGVESIHHREENLVGLGDLRVGGAFRLSPLDGSWKLLARAGLAAPTGNVEPNPFALGERGESHQHVFFGAGTVDPLLGMEASYAHPTFRAAAKIDGRTSLYSGRHGYRQGTRVTGGVDLSWRTGNLSLAVHPGLYYETASRWNDRSAENSGRIDLLASASAAWAPAAGTRWVLSVGRPITLTTEGGQFDTSWQLGLGVQWSGGSTPER